MLTKNIIPPLFSPLLLAAVVAAAALLAWPLRAAEILREKFDYSDGPIHTVSKRAWTVTNGSPAIAIEKHAAALPGGDAPGYVTRAFTAKPAGAQATATLQARFDGPVQAGKSRLVLFQFTDASGKKRRGRLLMRAGSDNESVQLGVTSKNSTDAVWSKRELPLSEEHTLVFHYDSAGGSTRLWINPTAATTKPDVEAADADAVTPGRVSLQVDSRWNLGRVLLTSIIVTDAPPAASRPPAATQSAPPALSAQTTPSLQPFSPSVLQPFSPPPPAKRFYVFLLAGQSNMAGRGLVGETDRAPDPRILAFAGPGRWIPATEPLHNDKRGAGVGPGLAFARALLPHLPPDVSIGLIPAAFGGTSMAQWQKDYKGDFRWPDGRTLFQLATESALAAAKEGTLAGILWNQGEADGSRARRDGGVEYRARLDALIADFRATLDRPDLPFVAATLGPWRRPNTTELNQVYLDLPARVPRTAVVDTLAPEFAGKLRNKPNDPAHYDTDSARLLGAAYARAMLTLGTPRTR
ncbi:MAG: sialate O-acetylesterase [Opitutaceae bacterium]|jgi:hypothetical protein|nr:sialate O-acetylesterase [Opitutaceae bacterium]